MNKEKIMQKNRRISTFAFEKTNIFIDRSETKPQETLEISLSKPRQSFSFDLQLEVPEGQGMLEIPSLKLNKTLL